MMNSNHRGFQFGADLISNGNEGTPVSAGAVEIFAVPSVATHFAYLGDTGTVTINVQQGV